MKAWLLLRPMGVFIDTHAPAPWHCLHLGLRKSSRRARAPPVRRGLGPRLAMALTRANSRRADAISSQRRVPSMWGWELRRETRGRCTASDHPAPGSLFNEQHVKSFLELEPATSEDFRHFALALGDCGGIRGNHKGKLWLKERTALLT